MIEMILQQAKKERFSFNGDIQACLDEQIQKNRECWLSVFTKKRLKVIALQWRS